MEDAASTKGGITSNTKITLAVVFALVPVFLWAGSISKDVAQLNTAVVSDRTSATELRTEMRQELRDIKTKLDSISEQVAVVRVEAHTKK